MSGLFLKNYFERNWNKSDFIGFFFKTLEKNSIFLKNRMNLKVDICAQKRN